MTAGGGFRDRQNYMFIELDFTGSPCENENFAFKLISIVHVFIEDVSLVLSEKY